MAVVLFHNLRAFISTIFLLLLCFFFTTHKRSPSHSFYLITTNSQTTPNGDHGSCIALKNLKDTHSKCLYLKTHTPCISQGYVNHLSIFYCTCGGYPSLGYTLLALWLLVLFYLLGNTASQYFCPSVERLSRELRLPPTIAGVTLLSLGNGWPDLFASVVPLRSGSGEVGLSSVLGGAFFVSCVVVGIINVCASSRASARVDRDSFVRDVCFFLLVLSSLLVILLVWRINIWGAMVFTSLYFVSVLIVSVVHLCRNDKYDGLVVPILDKGNETISITKEARHDQCNEEQDTSSCHVKFKATASYSRGWLLDLINMRLYLPRRLTIPDVSEERWCKPFAVASATVAPLLVAILWNSKRGRMGITRDGLTTFLYASLVGLFLGAIALNTTKKGWPPKKGLFPWLARGFLMSVLWTCIIAEELVGLLVSLGHVFRISPSILGLTVLAWGNSIGDQIANVAMAVSGSQDGAQIAVSGHYAGPIFNTLAGLGSSLVVSAWSAHPMPFVIPVGPALFEILGFMTGGLVWALVLLPKRDMKLDRVLGVGLLAIYSCFLSLRLSQRLGLVP